MIDQIVFSSSNDRVQEGSRLNVTAQFRDTVTRLPSSPVPITVEWALTCPDDGRTIQDFTTVTPGASVTLATTGTQNTFWGRSSPSARPTEGREVVVMVDRGLATQFVDRFRYTVCNVGAINP